MVFVPYRGIYFLYKTQKAKKDAAISFSSPIGESTFSTLLLVMCREEMEWCFRPLSGNLLSLLLKSNIQLSVLLFSSPIGESTFSTGMGHDGRFFELSFSSPIGESTFSTLPLEPLCLSGFQSCFAGQNLKIVFLFLFLMLAPLFPLFYAVRRKILFTAGKTLFFPFPYHIIFLDISCICIHAVQLQGLRPLHVYAVHTL